MSHDGYKLVVYCLAIDLKWACPGMLLVDVPDARDIDAGADKEPQVVSDLVSKILLSVKYHRQIVIVLDYLGSQ